MFFLVLSQNTHVTDRQTDGRRDGRMNGPNYDPQDRASIAAWRGKSSQYEVVNN